LTMVACASPFAAVLIASARAFNVLDAGVMKSNTFPFACSVNEPAGLMLVFDGSVTVAAPAAALVALACEPASTTSIM